MMPTISEQYKDLILSLLDTINLFTALHYTSELDFLIDTCRITQRIYDWWDNEKSDN